MADTPDDLKGRPLRRLFRLLGVERKEITYIYIYAIINGLIYLSLPLGIQAILGLTLANEISSSWVILIVIVTLGTALAGAMQVMQISITEMLQQRIFTRSAFEFAYRIPRLKLEAIQKYYPPELVNRFFDTLQIQKGLPKILIDFSTAILQILFGLILLSFYHPFFVFFGVGLVSLLVLIVRATGGKGLTTSLDESEYKYQVAFWLEELARTLSTFKLAGDTRLPMEKTDKLVSKYLDARKKHFRVLIFQYGNIVAFKTVITAGLLIIGSILLIGRQINLGQFVASEIVIILIISSVEKLVLSADTVYDVLTAVEKIGKVTDLPLEQRHGIPFQQMDDGKGMAIRVKDLEFSHHGDPHPSLSEISLEAAPGEKVCISGYNGSGKTLLLNVIAGLYDSDTYRGILTYNDIPFSNYDPVPLRGYIGDFLSQKNLFRGTLLENLTINRPEVQIQDVMWALEQLELKDYVQSLPRGLETMILPDDPRMPQSVARKLVLAKCIAKVPRLLLMDELLDIVDLEERTRITQFLTTCEKWTLIGVSNDPVFASRCNKVYIMEKGRIVDSGSYEEVVRRPYAKALYCL
ncbi:MAG: ATP-binding cassette domain-containing protein [Bacteroidetes bacterium]|nr:MAG: ATP-binding cassette domain-containing protein [Bacteroidota bacterium]